MADGKANRAEAVAKFHDLMAVASKAVPVDAPGQTVASVIEAYLGHALQRLSPRSYHERKALLAEFAKAHGFRLVSDLKPIHFDQWLDAHPSWASDWTLAHVVAVVKRPFNWAAKMEMIGVNPIRNISRSVGSPRRPLTDAEFSGLMRGAPGPKGKPFRQVLVMLRLTGMRPGEVGSLRWTDINLDTGAIVLQVHKTSKKTGKPRVIPLTRPVIRLLAHRRLTSASDFVFTGQRGNPWNRSSLSLRIQRARKRQGIAADAKLYGLRHKFGTEAIVNGVDIKTLAQLMGHASTRQTDHYLHLHLHGSHLASAMLQATRRRSGA